MLVQLAWRNIWRNTRRTVINLIALAIGVMGIVLIQSYRESTFTQMMQTITSQLVGHIQIHGRGYQESPEVGNVVADPMLVEAAVKGVLPGVMPERRVLGSGLAGTDQSASGALVMGVEPGKRTYSVTSGRDFAASAAREAVLGAELAQQLGVAVGAEVVLVGQAADGSVANDRYAVVGLADSGSADLNATGVFLHLKDAQEFFGLGDGVHTLLLRLPTDAEDLSVPLAATRAALDLKVLEALSWNEILPELRAAIDLKRQGQHSIDFIIFLIVGLGILNTMTMSVFERTREIGVMLALGTRPRRVLALIVTEGLLQGALGLAIGLALSVTVIFGVGEISMGSLGQADMLGVSMPSHITLMVPPSAIVSAAVTILGTMLAGGVLPALRASRLVPVEAMRAH